MTTHRKVAIGFSVAAALASALWFLGGNELDRNLRNASQARRQDAPPNVVVVLIDDLGFGDVGAFGAPHMPTPHIDSLARDGVRFTQGYATASVCSPSRTSLMLGIYAQRMGKYTNDQVGVPIPDGHPTFAQFMRDAGFRDRNGGALAHRFEGARSTRERIHVPRGALRLLGSNAEEAGAAAY